MLPCYYVIQHGNKNYSSITRSKTRAVDIIFFHGSRSLHFSRRYVICIVFHYILRMCACYFPDFSPKKIMNMCIRLPLSVSEESSFVKITECVSHPSGKISTPSHRVRDVCFRNTRARLVRRCALRNVTRIMCARGLDDGNGVI